MASPSPVQRIYSGPNSQGGAVFQGDLRAARDININHITSIRPFARSLYRSCLTSSELFTQVQNELGILLAVLETTEDNSNELHFDADHHPQLCRLSRDCHQVLQDLQRLKGHFDSIGTQGQLTWERMGWGTHELTDIRSRLMSYIGVLNVFNSNIINSSQARIEQMLRTFIDELRTGKREGSVVSIQTAGSLSADEKEAWRQLRKELESVGITPMAFAQNRDFIVATLQKAIIEEGLAGDIPCTYDSSGFPDSGQEAFEALPAPGAIPSAEPNVKYADEPLQQPNHQPNQGRISSNRVSSIGSPGRSRNVGRMMKLLLRMTSSKTAIVEAAKRGDAILVGRLLDKRAAVDSNDGDGSGQTSLLAAAANGHEAVVKLLLDKGAAVDSKGKYDQTPLSRAAANGREAVVKLLLDKGATVGWKNRYGQTPLSQAAGNGHEAVVKLLLDKGAAVDSKDGYSGQTSLSKAAANGHEAVVKLLLDKGAAVDPKDRHEAMVKLLLNKEAAVGPKDGYSGQTPLSKAAANGREAVVKLLLDKGAAVDSMDGDGWTPLWEAAANGHEAVVKLLLDKGAAVDSKDRYGQTPLSKAAANRHRSVVKLLKSRGALSL